MDSVGWKRDFSMDGSGFYYLCSKSTCYFVEFEDLIKAKTTKIASDYQDSFWSLISSFYRFGLFINRITTPFSLQKVLKGHLESTYEGKSFEMPKMNALLDDCKERQIYKYSNLWILDQAEKVVWLI